MNPTVKDMISTTANLLALKPREYDVFLKLCEALFENGKLVGMEDVLTAMNISFKKKEEHGK